MRMSVFRGRFRKLGRDTGSSGSSAAGTEEEIRYTSAGEEWKDVEVMDLEMTDIFETDCYFSLFRAAGHSCRRLTQCLDNRQVQIKEMGSTALQ